MKSLVGLSLCVTPGPSTIGGWWVVVGGEWGWWVVVGGGGWWWVVVGGGGWWWVVVGGEWRWWLVGKWVNGGWWVADGGRVGRKVVCVGLC